MEAIFYNSKQKSQKREFILACANFFVQELGIKNSRKRLVFVSKKEASFDVAECYGATTMVEDFILVYVNPHLSVESLIQVIAHEMIHVAQFARGHLVKWVGENDETVTTWCGKRYDETEYLELPWEIKAYEKQDRLAYKLAQILYP
jgi:hypothetical protein